MKKETNMTTPMSKMVEWMFEMAYKNRNTRPGDFQWAMQEYKRQKEVA